MKVESLLTRSWTGVGFLRSPYIRKGLTALVKSSGAGADLPRYFAGCGGKWLAATRSTVAANCGLTAFNHETAMAPESPALSGSLLTLREVAARLRVCRRTIEREIAAGHFPSPLKIGRCVRVPESDLHAYLGKLKRECEGPP